MPRFEYSFIVNAPRASVTRFHHSTSVLKQLMPPPVFAQIHLYEPLANGSRSEFTLWFGPLPIRWVAVHSQVTPHGFVDTQETGPLRRWQHTHQFLDLGDGRTRIQDEIDFEHHPGLRGILSRLLFPPPLLWLLFTYRRLAITRALR